MSKPSSLLAATALLATFSVSAPVLAQAIPDDIDDVSFRPDAGQVGNPPGAGKLGADAPTPLVAPGSINSAAQTLPLLWRRFCVQQIASRETRV